ncbi:hypothetical protein ABZ897_39170 [Nonomuraea sp. NPDC046802]|uniref:hypothetical protein n=1 Tax=Nonomuraea sp. NPDC046802 TaxID=3154919 RepID=UPI0033D2FCFB
MRAPDDLRTDARPNGKDALERMAALAEIARKEETWAFDALSRFVEECAGLRLDPLGIAATPDADRGRVRLLEILGQIVRAAHDEGALREDVGAGDILGVVGLLVRGLPTLPADLGDELGRRAARLVLAGVRAHPAPAPPGEAMTAEDLIHRLSR